MNLRINLDKIRQQHYKTNKILKSKAYDITALQGITLRNFLINDPFIIDRQ